MTRFNSLVYVQHFDAQNSKKKKTRKNAVYNYTEHMQHCKTF